MRLPVRAEVAVAEIVRLDQEDVRTCRSLARGKPGVVHPDGDAEGQQQQPAGHQSFHFASPSHRHADRHADRYFVNVTRVSALSLYPYLIALARSVIGASTRIGPV